MSGGSSTVLVSKFGEWELGLPCNLLNSLIILVQLFVLAIESILLPASCRAQKIRYRKIKLPGEYCVSFD